jgi:hypothetical protein
MPRTSRPSPLPRALCFVDAKGGAFGVLAAAMARLHGRGDAVAATTTAPAVPAEVGLVLAEVGASAPEVLPAGKLPRDAERVDVSGWDLPSYTGEGDRERIWLARIARDRAERRVEAMIAASAPP